MNALAEQLQIALVAALLADTTFVGIGGAAVYDETSAQDVFPRTIVGEGQSLPKDTQFDRLTETYAELDFYTRGPKCRLIAKRMADRAAELLCPPPESDGSEPEPPFQVPGHLLNIWAVHAFHDLTEPDAKTARVRLTLCFETQPFG